MSKKRNAKFFPEPSDFRAWLEEFHDKEEELIVGFYKKATGKPSITWPESVDEALCFGWIDGIRRRLDDERYSIRFTPRRKDSHWSKVNITRYKELLAEKRVKPAGKAAFRKRTSKNTARASYEQGKVALLPAYRQQLRSNAAAWKFFQGKPPSYRKQCTWWIMSAKRDATREKRLGILISCCERNEVIPPLKWTSK